MNVWILTGVRSGSKFLGSLLNRSNVFNKKVPFIEHFNFKAKRSLSKRAFKHDFFYEHSCCSNMAKEYLFNHYKQNFYELSRVTIHRYQFLKFFKKDKEIDYIESYIPEIKYIILDRDDLYARTISNYFAINANIWHIYNNKNKEKNSFQSQKILFEEKKIIKIYSKMKKIYGKGMNGWSQYINLIPFERKFIIDYDELMINPNNIIINISNYIGENKISKNDVQKGLKLITSLKTERPESQEYIEKLKSIIKE